MRDGADGSAVQRKPCVDGTPGRGMFGGLAAHLSFTRRREAVGCVYMPLKGGRREKSRLFVVFDVNLPILVGFLHSETVFGVYFSVLIRFVAVAEDKFRFSTNFEQV